MINVHVTFASFSAAAFRYYNIGTIVLNKVVKTQFRNFVHFSDANRNLQKNKENTEESQLSNIGQWPS